jgi:predicted Zn-dependent protease
MPPYAPTRLLLVLLLSAAFALAPRAAHTQLVHSPAFKDQAWRALDLMYNMQHNQAEAVFDDLRRQHPDHPAPYFCLALNLWWQIYPNNLLTTLDDRFLTNLDKCIELSDKILEKTPEDDDALFLNFASLAFKARWNAIRNNYFTGARLVLKCLPALKHSAPHKEQYEEFLFGSGLYNYYAEWFNLYKPIARPFLFWFPRGDMKKGLQELEVCAGNQNYVRVEAAIFLSEIYSEYERNYERAHLHASNLAKRYPQNTLFQLLWGRALYRINKLDSADAVLKKLEAQYAQDATARKEPLYFTDARVTTQMMQDITLTRGLIAKARGDYKAAIALLQLADGYCRLNGEADKNTRPRAVLEIAQCYDALQNRTQAVKYYNQVLELENNELFKTKAKDCLQAPCLPVPLQNVSQPR